MGRGKRRGATESGDSGAVTMWFRLKQLQAFIRKPPCSTRCIALWNHRYVERNEYSTRVIGVSPIFAGTTMSWGSKKQGH